MAQIRHLFSTSFGEFSTHPSYNMRIFDWLFIRDALEGESAIKFKNELYLPMPASMAGIGISPVVQMSQSNYYSQFYGSDAIKDLYQFHNPNYHPNQAYSAYLTRASFPELPSYTIRGLIGLSLKKYPTVRVPKELEYLIDHATVDGLTMNEYFAHLLEEVLNMGRIVSAFDTSVDGEIYFTSYSAESAINWEFGSVPGEDSEIRRLRLVEKQVSNFDSKPTALSFNDISSKVVKIIDLGIISGQYTIMSYVPNSNGEMKKDGGKSVIIPSYKGKTLGYVPAMCIGSLNRNFKIDPAPILPIARAAQHIYMKSADLSQSEFMSCSPTLVGTGIDAENKPTIVGATIMLMIPNPEARVYYTKTDTSALSHVKAHMSDIYTAAVNLGAQLLDTSPKPAETAETTRMKQAASTATLLTSLRSVANSLEAQLKQIAVWKGANPKDCAVIPAIEFIPPAITAAEIRELVQSWLNDAISRKTVFTNMKKAGIIDEDTIFEDEVNAIKEEYVEPGSPKFIRRQAAMASGRGGLKPDNTPNEENNNGNN